MDNDLEIFLVVAPGLESVLAEEARAAGFAVRLIPGIEAELETPGQTKSIETLNQHPDARRSTNPARKAA